MLRCTRQRSSVRIRSGTVRERIAEHPRVSHSAQMCAPPQISGRKERERERERGGGGGGGAVAFGESPRQTCCSHQIQPETYSHGAPANLLARGLTVRQFTRTVSVAGGGQCLRTSRGSLSGSPHPYYTARSSPTPRA